MFVMSASELVRVCSFVRASVTCVPLFQVRPSQTKVENSEGARCSHEGQTKDFLAPRNDC